MFLRLLFKTLPHREEEEQEVVLGRAALSCPSGAPLWILASLHLTVEEEAGARQRLSHEGRLR